MIPIGSLTIVHNRQSGLWEVQGCEPAVTFQSGPVGRSQALKFAIRQEYPEVAAAVERLVSKHPPAAGRAWDAAYLLVAGHVLVPGVDASSHHVARVVSQADGRLPHHYYIGDVGESLTCTCQDYSRGGIDVGAYAFCKHVLAYCLGQYLGWPLQEQPAASPRPRKEAGGVWRSRVVTRVNGGATRNGAGHGPETGQAGGNGAPAYANGEPVQEAHQVAYEAFVNRMRTAPYSQEKLMSWYYGR
ncbi:MAG: hypothetical protein L0332_30780 [Chloroflexi bacterium]|nr:hypothetical protein [Chloroflexota bacterium]MCI0731085.1 hypothetical protein [Chloroflexota bacterium]